jgi:DNA-binding transcriptional LysR family regulator
MHAPVLRYFREVARQGSVRRAAATLNVAASAVNRQLLKLEDRVGAPLFDRLPGRMRLTAAGELLLRHVDQSLGDFERVRAEIDALRGVRTGHVTVVAVDSLLVDLLPQVVASFSADFPAVTYTVLAQPPADIAGEVAAGRADVGVTFVTRVPAGLQFTTTISAPVGVIMAPRHPLARRRQVRFDEARPYPVVMPIGRLPQSVDIDPDFTAFRASLQPKLVSNSIQAIRQALRQDMGIAFFTRFGFLHEIGAGELAWRPFASRRINTLRLGLLTPTTRKLSFAAQMFAERLASSLEAMERSG